RAVDAIETHAVAIGLGRETYPQTLRVSRWANAVDADVVPAYLPSDSPSKADNCGLSAAVRGAVLVARIRSAGGERNDCPTSGRNHVPEGLAGAEEGANGIADKDLVPFIERQFNGWLQRKRSAVVSQGYRYVHLSELCHSGIKQAPDIAFILDV